LPAPVHQDIGRRASIREQSKKNQARTDASFHALRLPSVKVMDSIDVKGSSFDKAGDFPMF
jgi:hypothetical protein